MALHLRALLILTGLTGIHSITTVSKVSVKAGTSISIPCFYESRYKNNVKYLCEGYSWSSCSYVIKTNQPSSSKFSISDDKKQRIFTVTIKDLTSKDTDYYWCAVEITGGPDDKKYFHLSVTTDTPSLYVAHQQITGFKGEKIIINCHHRVSGETKWCRLGHSCVTEASGSIDRTRVTINTSVRNVFTVTMSELKIDSSGWYWCVKGDLQMPVHLTVTEKPTTTTLPTTTRLTTLSTTPEPANLTTGFVDKAHNVEQHSDLMSLIIPLSLLIFIVMVTLFIWFMLKKHKRTGASAATTASEGEVTYSSIEHVRQTSSQRPTERDVDVIYSAVVTTRKKSVQKAEGEVTYSTVKKKRKTSRQQVEAKAPDATYSTLAQHQQTL